MDLDSFVKVENVDPAAEFIAREQSVLADISSDIDFTDDLTHLSQEMSEETSNITQYDENVDSNNLSDDVNPFLSANEVPLVAEDDNENLVKIKLVNGFSEPPKMEHEKITRWKAESVRLLAEKDEEEARRKQQLAEQAKKELEEWYEQYHEQLKRSKTNNRNAEAEWVSERDAEVPGKEWEKVARMCDFNPKLNQKNTKDTSRMRSLMLQLKQNPPKEFEKSSQ